MTTAGEQMFGNIYRGLKVFITGHTGFKGSWLSAWLLSQEAAVAGLSLDVPTAPSCYEALGLKDRLQCDLRGDVRDLPTVADAISRVRPDVVFHLAAQALVRESYAEPVRTFETNMLGTLNVLEAMRRCPSVAAGVIITSDKCYRNDEWVYGYRETDPLGGSDPYSASKGCAEFIAHSYFDSFFSKTGPSCATVRAGNVIGGGDWAKDRIVPDCARAWQAGKPVLVRSPNATRPWQHVLEPLSGYLWLGARLLRNDIDGCSRCTAAGQAYNFGPPADAVYPVAEVVKILGRHWNGFKFEIADARQGSMKECGLLKLCCDKALAELDWKATLDFEETLRYTADWYARFHADGANMWDYTQGQINAYVNAAQARGLLWAQG